MSIPSVDFPVTTFEDTKNHSNRQSAVAIAVPVVACVLVSAELLPWRRTSFQRAVENPTITSGQGNTKVFNFIVLLGIPLLLT